MLFLLTRIKKVPEECDENMATRMRVAMGASTPPSSPVVARSEKLRKFKLICRIVKLRKITNKFTIWHDLKRPKINNCD